MSELSNAERRFLKRIGIATTIRSAVAGSGMVTVLLRDVNADPPG